MNDSVTTRRRFLVAAIAFSGVTAGTFGPAALRFGSAWAQSGDNSAADALAGLGRLLLPHDGLANNVYAEVLNEALAKTAGDTSLRDVEVLLNAQQPANFKDIDEDSQVAAMRAIEGEDSFAAVLNALKTRLYDHPTVWKVIKYEGPSYQNGGYLHRGAGDIDWLPEAD